MSEVLVKTHLIVSDSYHKYHMNWCGKILDADPELKDGKPIFAIVGSNGRMEINTTDMARIEKCAKLMTAPKGRAAITTDTSRIFIKEKNGNELLLGTMRHDYIREFSPMYDKIEFI